MSKYSNLSETSYEFLQMYFLKGFANRAAVSA